MDEYESLIVFRLEFDQPDTWNESINTVSWNYSISKASLLCGDAVVKDAAGRTIRPEEVISDKKAKKRDGHGNGSRGGRRPGDRMGMRDVDRDSLI